MRRLTVTSTVAFCVVAGLILGEFIRAVRPVDFLLRPLILAIGLAIAIGLAASALGRWSILGAVFVAAWLVQPGGSVALGIAAVLWVLVAYRLSTHHLPKVDGPLITASVVFMLAGLVPIFPLLTLSHTAQAETSAQDDPPQYAILLDGYPRADTLEANGIDVSSFLDALEDRGFDIYQNATSTYYRTFQTLTEMTGGTGDEYVASINQMRQMRDKWTLPDGWVTIAPPIGEVTLPNETVLNPGVLTRFEQSLIAGSAFGPFAGNWALDQLRRDLNNSLDILASTSELQVFAHFLAPHTPFLYGAEGEPTRASSCWPRCRKDTKTVDGSDYLASTGHYAEWLNGRILEVVDEIISRRPESEIVLFSDHGSRIGEESDDWYRVLFAARTPARPGLFAESPHPRHVLRELATNRLEVDTDS